MAIGVFVSLAALCASSANARAYGADRPALAAAASYSVTGGLIDVATVSPAEAWAVGWTGSSATKTLLLHWNGRKWSPVTSPFARRNYLNAVAATSAGDAWAVGEGTGTGSSRTLILHWNGRTWS